jgi:hypothetical protein
MSNQVGATNLDDLDDLDVNDQLINELDDMIDEDQETDTGDVKIENPVKVSGSIFSNKLKKNAIDTTIILVLILVFGNKYTMHYLFKLPFLVRFENSAWGPIAMLTFLVCLFFFITKIFI